MLLVVDQHGTDTAYHSGHSLVTSLISLEFQQSYAFIISAHASLKVKWLLRLHDDTKFNKIQSIEIVDWLVTYFDSQFPKSNVNQLSY